MDAASAPLAKICRLPLNVPVADVLRAVPGWIFVQKHMFRAYHESAVIVELPHQPKKGKWMAALSKLRRELGPRVRLEKIAYSLEDIKQRRRSLTNVLSVQLFTKDGQAVERVGRAEAREVLAAVQEEYPDACRAKLMEFGRRRFTNLVFVEMPSVEAARQAAGGSGTGKVPVLDGGRLPCGIVAHALQVDETPFEEREGVVVVVQKEGAVTPPTSPPLTTVASDAFSVGHDTSDSEECVEQSTPVDVATTAPFRHDPYNFESSKQCSY